MFGEKDNLQETVEKIPQSFIARYVYFYQDLFYSMHIMSTISKNTLNFETIGAYNDS